jgi:hypothetical protein
VYTCSLFTDCSGELSSIKSRNGIIFRGGEPDEAAL